MTTSSRNNGGFTLIEVLIATVILMIAMLGLLQSIDIALQFNLKNQMRDEAVYMGEKYMNEFKGRGYTAITGNYSTLTVASKIRGGKHNLTVDRSWSDMGANTKQLQILVKWKYKGVEYENRVISPISQLQ